MTTSHQISIEKKRAIKAVSTSAIIIVLLAVYAFLTTSDRPIEVTITGTVTAQSATVEKIIFTNTGCGSKHEATFYSIGETSVMYKISLFNGYSYNVSIAWNNQEGKAVEATIGKLVLDTFDRSLVRDWTVLT